MSLSKQISLVAAGCQPWHVDVCSACADRFAYSATLAIYIFQFEALSHGYRLLSIQSEHKKSITAISWSPYDVNLIVSASIDGVVILYNVAEQTVVARLEKSTTGGAPCSIAWGLPDPDGIMFIGGKGPLIVWNRKENLGRIPGVSSHQEVRGLSSNVSLMRCHPSHPDKIALGHVDGSISIFCPGQKAHKHVLRPEDRGKTENGMDFTVKSLEWDPLSTDYLLVATAQRTLTLVDSRSATEMMFFEMPNAAVDVRTLAWVPTAPGMFITGDENTGVLRLWNVSKASPIENLRLKKAGFGTMLIIPFASNTDDSSVRDVTAEGDVGKHSQAVSYTVPQAHVLCTFLDGGVGLYDIRKRKWIFLKEMGHIETIFDCQFHPDDADILATGSFDGTVKVWNVSTLKPIFTSPGNEGIIYSLSWSPADLHCLAASTAKEGVFVLNIEKGKVVQRFKEHGSASVFTVAWNLKDGRRIASAGEDGQCVIRQFDGKFIIAYRHPAAVFGCDWSPHSADIIATGCGDSIVRVFYLTTNNDKELRKFSGHTEKVFRVKWCPLREGILVSGSDDRTIRMWDYTQEGGSIRVFQGHTAPVRGLLWNLEVPYLLMSGSWDHTIRVWDTRDGACLDTILDHGGDVYGLACHHQRPFIVASCSRDSTLRLWSLSMLVQPLEIHVLCGRPWNESIVAKEHAMTLGKPPLFAGKASRDIKHHLDELHSAPEAARNQAIHMFSNLFANPHGSRNLWDLVHVSLGSKTCDVSSSYKNGIIHRKHLTQYKQAEARELEMTKINRNGHGIKARSTEDQLREAADIHIKLGNIMQYCELMMQVGQWDQALIMAPAVSVDYWAKIMQRRAECLVANDSDISLPYCIASGNVSLAVQFLSTRGQHSDAILVAAADEEGLISATEAGTQCEKESQREDSFKLNCDGYLRKTSEELAERYFHDGLPVLAACCHLAVDDHKKAMSKLIRGGELELAVGIGLVLTTVPDHLRLAAELLARRCEKIGQWELGIELLKSVPGTETSMAQLCCRCAASMSEKNALHVLAGLPSMDNCVFEAEKCESLFDRVKYYMLSSSPELGLQLGLAEVKERMKPPDGGLWRAEEVTDLLQMMSSLQTERLLQAKFSRYLRELLMLSAYIGGLVAVARRYDAVVPSLFRHAIFLMQRDTTDLPLTQQLVRSELEVWSIAHSTTARVEQTLSPNQMTIYEKLMHKAGRNPLSEIIEAGPDRLSGSQLPSHSDVNFSCLNAQRILGPSFFLEDGHSCLSINDAYMWAKVNPFSPLGSGMRMNPF